MKNSFLQVGIITTTHGVHGEVKVRPTTDDIERFKDLTEVTLSFSNGKEEKRTIRSVKFFKNQAILGFDGIDDMDSAYTLRNARIMIDRSQAIPLEENEFFIGDILGISVYDEDDRLLGKCTDIIPTGANDVYEVTRDDGKKILIPAIKQCIIAVDPDQGQMKVHLIPGLEDL
ncbi:MAG: ribosome maturation factor RimM [Lachnospiraceae bacterium]|nr:ribosome maturation factor RimM [Lachnospiraceae bacterium]